jgi:hypothetical protein
MNFELFDKAVDFIASREDKQLNLGNWQAFKPHITPSSAAVNCGTIACAGGWIALNPEFEALGMSAGSFGAPRFRGLSSYDALAKLFDISINDARDLFYFKTSEDTETFGESAFDIMTDRQLWLSRARLLREKYAHKVSNKYRNKPVEVEAYTFQEIIKEGVASGANMVNGMPWSFAFKGYPVTHERDDLYMIQLGGAASLRYLTPNSMLVIGPEGAYTIGQKIFEASYECVQ